MNISHFASPAGNNNNNPG